jgi:dienelactone hydrolase
MRFRDYMAEIANQAIFSRSSTAQVDSALDHFTSFVASNGSPREAVEQWYGLDVAARRAAPAAAGRHPLVLLAQGKFNAAYSQAILAEYLASYGYVVATSPSPALVDSPTASTDSLPDRVRVIVDARRQAADLEYVWDLLVEDNRVDRRRVAIVAHSFGARATFVALIDHYIPIAFVSLDGGIANRLGRDWLDSVSYDPASIETPILHLYQDRDSTVQPDFTLLYALRRSDRTLVRVNEMYHPYFTALGFVAAAVPDLRVSPRVRSLSAKVGAVAVLTRRFLDATLAGSGHASGPASARLVRGVPAGVLEISHLAQESRPSAIHNGTAFEKSREAP